jgi:hypothetical protein
MLHPELSTSMKAARYLQTDRRMQPISFVGPPFHQEITISVSLEPPRLSVMRMMPLYLL